GFNFLEKINAITDSSSNPEQENTAENNNQSEQPESDEQDKSETTTAEENNSANVEEQQNYQIANGKVTGLENGKKGNMKFFKMAIIIDNDNMINLYNNNYVTTHTVHTISNNKLIIE